MTTEKRRPWWAAAVAGGIGIGLGLLPGLLGAREKVVKPAIAAELDPDRLARIESKVNDIAERVARIEGRLERK